MPEILKGLLGPEQQFKKYFVYNPYDFYQVND